jgi:hypothetical protein
VNFERRSKRLHPARRARRVAARTLRGGQPAAGQARLDLMAIPRRKRRTIRVDGVEYHWVIGNRNDHRQPRATVQRSPGFGAKLFIDPIGILCPSDIVAAIQFALAHGWNPEANSPHLYLGFDETAVTSRFILRTPGDMPYWKEKWFGLPNTGQSQSPPSGDQPGG